MGSWLLLIAGVAAGALLLARWRALSFRGSTLLGFLLLTIGLTSPLALDLSRPMLASGAGEDAFIGVWNLWWTRIAAAQGENPLFTRWVFHPAGTSLALHTYSLTYGVASLPLQWIGAIFLKGASDPAAPARLLFVAYNLILIASFTLSGYLLYRLALSLTGHRGGAILGGILFAYSDYRYANTVRLHVLATEFLVLALWAWIAFLRRPSPRGLLLLAGAGCLLLYASLEYTAYAALLFLVPLLGRGVRRVSGAEQAAGDAPPRAALDLRRRRWFSAGVLSLFLGGLFVLPYALELAHRLSQGGAGFDPRLAVIFSADLLDFLLPNPRHPLWGRWIEPITARFHHGDGGFGLSLGWVALAVFGVCAAGAFRGREGRRWLWGFLFFLALTLGPKLHLAGAIVENPPLPQAWLSRVVPFLGGSRTPIRYLAPAWVCLSLLVAVGWAARERSRAAAAPRGRPAGGTAVGSALAGRREIFVGALLLFESLSAPLTTARLEVPEAYGRVRAAPGYYALVTVPAIPSRDALLYQTIHQQRLVQSVETSMPLHSPQGNAPFATPHWETLTRSLGTPGWIANLPAPQQTPLVGALRRFLGEYRIRFLVLQRTRLALSPDGRGFVPLPLCEEAQFAAFRENLRRLHPLHEREFGDAVLFEFESTEIRE